MPSPKTVRAAAATDVIIHEHGTDFRIPYGYTLQREFTGTRQGAQFRFARTNVVLVAGPELTDKPGNFNFEAYGFKPVFGRSVMAGWYITNLAFPDGCIPNISNEFPDKKWRLTNDPRSTDGGASSTGIPTKGGCAQAVVELINEMKRSTEAATAEPQKDEPKTTLYLVTLPWGTSSSDTGDYSAKVWATDREHAVLLLAQEMASESTDLNTDAEREQFVAKTVERAGTYAAVEVAPAVVDGVLELLKGPTGTLCVESNLDFEAIKAILKKYSAV